MSKILIDEALRLADAIQLGWLENVDADKADIDMIQTELRRLHTENQALRQALAEAALDKMADNARELELSYEKRDCDHYWKYIGSKRQTMWECVKCGMYEVPDAPPECKYGNEPASCTSSPMDCQCAIDTVFEQPVKEQCWMCGDMDAKFQAKCTTPYCAMKKQPAPAQEPVCGWGLFDLHDGGKLFAHCSSKQAAEKYAYEVSGCRDRFEIHPLTIYTTKPAQQPDPDELTIAYLNGIDTGKKRKPWVGLTDEEIAMIHADYPNPQGFAKAIIAKLKEKNTKGGA